MKHRIVLQDNITGKKFYFGMPSDTMTKDITLLVPEMNGTILLEENITQYLTNNIIGNLRGYTGSKGDTGQGFKITAIFNSLTELLDGTTTEDTFALVAGTLPQTDADYGKLYHRLNNAWTYITDLSVEGANGIQGPQGVVGYTGSQGDIGYTGSKGDIGYTGSKGDQGPTGYNGSTGAQGVMGYTGSTGATTTLPAGSVIYTAGNTAPGGFLKANGSAISRTVYSALFSVIGTTYGIGDGTTTFNLPDLRGEFLRVCDDSKGTDTNRTLGSFQADELKSHTHSYTRTDVVGTATDWQVSGVMPSQVTANTDATGGTETRPRNIALLACIKY